MSIETLSFGPTVISGDVTHGCWIRQERSLNHDKGWMVSNCTKHLNPGDVVVNVGAHWGTITAGLLAHGCIVFAFEPHPESYQCLIRNCPGAICFNIALSDCYTDTAMTLDPSNSGASYIDTDGTVPVVTHALDDLHVPDIRLLIADAEGFEVKILRGAEQTIKRCKPVLVLEVNPAALERAGDSELALYALLAELGYGEPQILQPQCQRGDEQYDVLCQPR